MSKPAPITTKTIQELLRQRYSDERQWFFRFEVSNATGIYADSSADAVAMHLWPSRGLRLHGFEIKSTRSDWLRELKKPEKNADFIALVDHWWLVAPKGIALDSEIPPNWGVMTATPKTLRVTKDAPYLNAGKDAMHGLLPRRFVASLVRRPPDNTGEFEAAIARAVNTAKKDQAADFERRHGSLIKERDELREYQNEIAQIFGREFRYYLGDAKKDAKEIKAAIEFIRSVDSYNLANLENTAKRILTLTTEFRSALEGENK